ncbi:nitrogenase-stabilizing/protective protein NifW [Oryzomicrobium sp.]|uniref:nitrogenase-stabilizing/protective protein NifW n=1 Tax=Oryzomicrobium sp. TaxID=1911578 RepID=UPI0025F0D50D|nr:nitrogenase-stabilizing/protective protein NifW [Oryzomicrobium sp.]MCE1243030.1 nitrogenase-stabilizing/protective protein NifW [Oryzomicrobium sp.]
MSAFTVIEADNVDRTPTHPGWLMQLSSLSTAEEFLAYFGLPFDPRVVNVNRLHILKRFQQYLARDGGLTAVAAAGPAAVGSRLEAAYGDFVNGTAQQHKVFPVFERGTQRISLHQLRRGHHA